MVFDSGFSRTHEIRALLWVLGVLVVLGNRPLLWVLPVLIVTQVAAAAWEQALRTTKNGDAVQNLSRWDTFTLLMKKASLAHWRTITVHLWLTLIQNWHRMGFGMVPQTVKAMRQPQIPPSFRNAHTIAFGIRTREHLSALSYFSLGRAARRKQEEPPGVSTSHFHTLHHSETARARR